MSLGSPSCISEPRFHLVDDVTISFFSFCTSATVLDQLVRIAYLWKKNDDD